jgi:hypothetical protein
MPLLDPSFVLRSLNQLATGSQQVFGAEEHRFRLNGVLSEAQVAAFEKLHSVVLPPDYRHFLLKVGDGGAGPYYGVFPLGKMDDGFAMKSWQESDGFIGNLSKPFPLREAWNDRSGLPSATLAESNPPEYERQFEAFEEEYFDPRLSDGAFPICHMGCGLRIWLVVAGEQAGHLWLDGRADETGLSPIFAADGQPATFSTWYLGWLVNPSPAQLSTHS